MLTQTKQAMPAEGSLYKDTNNEKYRVLCCANFNDQPAAVVEHLRTHEKLVVLITDLHSRYRKFYACDPDWYE